MTKAHWQGEGRLPALTPEQQKKYPNVQIQRHAKRGGEFREYMYYRGRNMRITGLPGTPEFDASYTAAKLGLSRKSQKGGDTHYIYFVQCVRLRFVKIGRSRQPWTRFINIQTSCPDEVVLLGVIPCERTNEEQRVQAQFRHLHHHGEWYREADDLMAFISTIAEDVAVYSEKADLRQIQVVSGDRIQDAL